MNFNVWNIKDMLSIPSGSGTTKPSNWTNNQTDHSSLSDSQFLFGSQFCPESSETLSAPLDFGVPLRHPKQSQQNSLDSEPSIFTKYQTKPQLFGGDTKGGGLFPLPLPVGKSKGLLEQFEEKKKRAKDKCDSETLYNIISNIKESIHRLQTSVEKSEDHLSSRSQSILDSLETVAKTLQETMQAQNELVLGTMQDKGTLEPAVLEMQKRCEAGHVEFIEMKSSLKHLEVLVAQQSKDFQQLCEQLGQLHVPSVLAELKRLASAPRVPRHLKDSTSQTSPLRAQSLSPLGAQSPRFGRQDTCDSEEPATGHMQALPAAWTVRVGSPRPGDLGVQGEGAKSAALQAEAVLMVAGGDRRNRQVRDKAVQTHCQSWPMTKTGSEIHGVSVPVCQGPSRLISLDLNNFATSMQNTRQQLRPKGVFSCDSSEQRLATEQKGRTVESGEQRRPQRPRGARRSRPPAREQEQTLSKTCALHSQSPQPPGAGSQRPPQEQQDPLARPRHLCCPRSPTEPACPALRGTTSPRKRVRAAPAEPLPPSQHSSQGSSGQGDPQMSWFSNLNLQSAEPPLCRKPAKSVIYNLGFDSSDDGF